MRRFFALILLIAIGLQGGGSVRAEPLELSRDLVLSVPPPILESALALHLPPLRKGSKGKAVIEFSDLLVKVGLTSFQPAQPDVYGADHEQAVKILQRHFGLAADGIAGPILYANLESSLASKNAAVEAFALRLEQLAHEARLEGRRKMIVVNVPSFTLRAIDLTTGKTVVETPVVVGRRDRQTPRGRFNIISLKYNPTWTPPPVVIKRDIVPKLGGGDAKWFEKHRLVATGPDGVVKEAHEVTREEYSAGWKFFQKAGKDNALGQLKFETDSKDSIYLHDTNEQSLFSKPNRTHSSGCIRVQKWAALAAFIADSTGEKIVEGVEKSGTRWQKIEKVPVFVEHSLGDAIAQKAIYFPDIYAEGGVSAIRRP